jgi:hypothetical protein
MTQRYTFSSGGPSRRSTGLHLVGAAAVEDAPATRTHRRTARPAGSEACKHELQTSGCGRANRRVRRPSVCATGLP